MKNFGKASPPSIFKGGLDLFCFPDFRHFHQGSFSNSPTRRRFILMLQSACKENKSNPQFQRTIPQSNTSIVQYRKIRYCFFRAYQARLANCVASSVSVFAEAARRQVRLRSASYDGTRQPSILKHH